MSENGERLVFLTIVVLLLGIAFGVGSCAIGGCSPNYSDGYRSGFVSKVSKKGVFLKSWEGEMMIGGVVTSDITNGTMIAEKWYFSCKDDALAQRISDLAMTGKRVRLHYRQWLCGPVSQDTQYVVDGVALE